MMAGWIAVAAAVASAVMSQQAQSGMEKRQKKLAEAMSNYQLSKSQESQAAIKGFTDTIQPDAKAAERTDINAELEQGLDSSVGAVRKFEAPQQIAGKVSDDFTQRTASNQGTVADRIRRAVQQLSIIGTPAEQGLRESRRLGVAAGTVDGANSAANNVGAAYMRGIQLQRPNPALSFGSQIFGGLSRAGGGGSFGMSG